MARLAIRLLLMSASFTVLIPNTALALSAPQYELWSKVKNSIGATPGVQVDALIDKTGGLYVIPIKATDHDQAVAIASIMDLTYKFERVTVQVQTTDGSGNTVNPVIPGSADQLADLVRKGLKGNPMLSNVIVKSTGIKPKKAVFVVFTKSVVQFPNDDTSDLYGNFNAVAAAVFRDVLADEPGGYVLAPSTSE